MASNDSIQRAVLPIPDRKPVGLTTYDAKDPDTKFPPIIQLRPPTGAPNVLVILLDDVGFGASSAFGGPCQTPTAERLAKEGLKYNRFHTTALCSPTRAALLSGRNHHAVGMGGITEIATSAPGYNSLRPNTCAPLAEILKLNGYSTAQFGKCHEVPVFESSPLGPFDHWPTGSGFEHFYGFIGGENNQYHPALYDGTTPIEPERTPEEGYHLMEDLADKAISWIRQQKALMPDKPFFVYFAPGATHAPHHVPQDRIAKYKGKFDQGWDKVREETFARQMQLGVIPSDCELTPRPKEIPAWEKTEERLRPVLAREMEIYAGFLEYADHHTGRVVDSLADLGIMDDTLIYYIIGDNGASAEGTLIGSFNEQAVGEAPDLNTPEFMIEHMDDLGTPRANNHYAVGWAHAMDTPYQWTKQVASRDPMAQVYPDRRWEWAFVGGSASWDAKGYVNVDNRAAWNYAATGNSPAMVQRTVGSGSQYLMATRDASGAFLDGGKHYRFHLPPNVPVKAFWSIVVYDALSRSELQNGEAFPSISQYTGPVANADDSVDIYFGPQAPKGKEKNWIKTIPGKGWFPYLRLYSPTEAFFNQTWKPDDIVEMN